MLHPWYKGGLQETFTFLTLKGPGGGQICLGWSMVGQRSKFPFIEPKGISPPTPAWRAD